MHQNRTIGIVGSGFTPHGEVTWRLLAPDGAVASTDAGLADDDGRVYRQVTPTTTTPPGTYTLEITDGTTNGVAHTTLLVLPAAEAPPLPVTVTTEPGSGGTTLVHASGLPRGEAAEFALAHEGISGLSHVTTVRADHDGHVTIPLDASDLGGLDWIAFLNTGDGWFTDGTAVSAPPSGPFLHFRDGIAQIHEGRITRVSAHNLPEHSTVTWKVLGPGGSDEGTWEGTAFDGSDSQWLTAPSWMEPGMYTVELRTGSDPGATTLAWAAFEVLPAADAPPLPYTVEVGSDDVKRGDVVTVTVRGGGIHAGLIPVNPITDRSVSEDLSQPDEIGRRTADLDTSRLPAEYDRFYVAVHDGHTWHLTGTEISVGGP